MTLGIRAGRKVSRGTICKTLHRLEARGLARSRLGTPRPEPGGRRRMHYAITPTGQTALIRRSLRSRRSNKNAAPEFGGGVPDRYALIRVIRIRMTLRRDPAACAGLHSA